MISVTSVIPYLLRSICAIIVTSFIIIICGDTRNRRRFSAVWAPHSLQFYHTLHRKKMQYPIRKKLLILFQAVVSACTKNSKFISKKRKYVFTSGLLCVTMYVVEIGSFGRKPPVSFVWSVKTGVVRLSPYVVFNQLSPFSGEVGEKIYKEGLRFPPGFR